MKIKFTQFRWLVTMILFVTAMAMPKMAWAEIKPTQPNIGDGTSANPYQIGTPEELYWFAALVNGELVGEKPNASAKLTADISVNSYVLDYDGTLNNNGNGFETWTPIGNGSNLYTGTFDGQGHTISGLYFNISECHIVGLFGANKGTIKNVGVVDSYFYGGDYVGGVCGANSEGGTITGCYNTGMVSGNFQVGGVCGLNDGSTITGCYNTGTVSGSDLPGGVCGKNDKGTITGCYTNSGVVCENNGGTVTYCGVKNGYEFRDGTVCSLLNTALKTAKASVRFYQGTNYPELFMNVPSLVDDVYQISNKGDLYAFALIVNNGETSAKAVLTANITVNTGVLKEDGTLADNYSGFETWTPIGKDQNPYTGTFDGQGHTISGLYFNNSGSKYVGLFRKNDGTIKNVGVVDSYFCGSSYVGGVCGGNVAQNENTSITNCYNTGAVSGSSYVGGVCGGIQVESNFTATITNCYYNSEKYTGNAVGDNNGTATKVEGKTTEQFKSGEVAYLLSQGTEGSVWGQQLGTDNYPVLSDYKVIKAAKGDKDANENDTYWATFSNLNSDVTLSVPSARNLNVYNATVSSGTMTLKKRTDNQVAKGEGVLLKTDGEYVNVKANATDGLKAVDYTDNNLVATPATEETINAATGYKLYRLTYNNSTDKTGLGFYLGLVKDENGNVISSDGSQLKATPGKAYLEVTTEAATKPSNAAPARGFVFPGDDDTTGIGEIVIDGDAGISGSSNANDRIYNLQGQQVSAPAKGLYIKNNKKVLIK